MTTETQGIAGGEHTLLWKKGQLFSAGACGLGWCRNLPMSADLFSFRPIKFTSQIQMAYASYYHNLAVDSKNNLYTWGCGTFVEGGMDGVIPALGPNQNQDLGGKPQKVSLPDENSSIRQITGGAYHSAVLFESGKVLTFGAGQLGQLGRPLTSKGDASGLPVDPNPKAVEGLDSAGKIKSIGSGFYNTFAITESGALYCTGENQNQQCGIGAKNLYKMTRIKQVNDPIDQVEGGYCHTLLRNVAGRVFSMGCGDDGQRGDGIEIDDDDDDDDDDETDTIVRPVISPVELPSPAVQVASGANHSVVLDINGHVYTFGANDVGQCGHDGDEPVVSPKQVKVSLSDSKDEIVKVSAGYAHTVLTSKKGKVLVFGQNDSGQLGLGGENWIADAEQESQTKPVHADLPDLET